MDNWALSDIERRLANVIRFGVVDQLDEAKGLVRVRSGEASSPTGCAGGPTGRVPIPTGGRLSPVNRWLCSPRMAR